jgi:transposase
VAAQYHGPARRMGRKKALVAVAHSLLVIVYHVLARRADYRELGGDYFDRRQHQTRQQRLIKRLEKMGLGVTVGMLPNATSSTTYSPVFIAASMRRCLATTDENVVASE